MLKNVEVAIKKRHLPGARVMGSCICLVLFLKQAVAYQFIPKLSIFKANSYLFCLFIFCLFACVYFSSNKAQSSKQ